MVRQAHQLTLLSFGGQVLLVRLSLGDGGSLSKELKDMNGIYSYKKGFVMISATKKLILWIGFGLLFAFFMTDIPYFYELIYGQKPSEHFLQLQNMS